MVRITRNEWFRERCTLHVDQKVHFVGRQSTEVWSVRSATILWRHNCH